MIKICQHGFSLYINFQRLWRFRAKHAGSCITGFTILEVMVAIFVITVGVISVFNVVQNVTMFSRVNSSRLTATYLAQEGIELVRNQRDTNWLLEPGSWNDNIPPAECGPTFILGKFTRTCTSTLIVGPPEKVEVSVEVKWQERGTEHSVTNATELYNWF